VNSVYKLLIQIIGKDVGASRELKETKREVDTLSQATSKLGSVFSIAALTGVAYMGKQLAETAWEMGKTGAQALRMEASFGKLADRIDTTGDALLRSLRDAASGTVSDMELMRVTAGLLASGIQTSTDDITDAMEIARLKAQQFGLTTTEAYDRMVTGARKFSVEMLDEIGINLRAESVYKRKAEALGVATSALTDAQKAESLWQAILEDGRREIEEYGGAVDDMATDIERASVAIENASLSAQMAMAPIVAGIAEMIPGAINRFELLGAAFEGVISLQEYYTAAGEAQRIEQEQGTEAARGYMAAVIATGGAILETADAQRDWTTYVELADRQAGIFMGTLHEMPGVLAQTETALEGHIVTLHRTAKAYMMLSDETKKWVAERTEADISGMDPYEMSEGQLAALDAIDAQREDNAKLAERHR
jgi:hypothetical protein